MFKNYLKIAVRNLQKRKVYTLINILGLATGMAVCVLIVMFIRSELGYDDFQQKGDRIYRVALERIYPGRSTSYAIIPISIGAAIHHEFPEVEENTRLVDISNNNTLYIKAGDKLFQEQYAFAADSNFFRVFSASLVAGDTATALLKQNTVVINEHTARKYFGSVSNAMGRTIEVEGGVKSMVSGVCRDWPDNTHLKFDLLFSSAGMPFMREPGYTGFSTYTYLLLRPNVSAPGLEAKLPQIVDKYVSGEIGRSFGQTYQQFLAAGNGYHYYLQPVRDIHLTSDLEAEIRPNGSLRAIYIFGVIAVFILVIACINFVNLSTARSVERAREVGIRKTFGSEKRSLVTQFLFESVLCSFLSMLLALGLILVLLPLFNKVSGKELTVWSWLNVTNIVLFILFSVVVGLIAGLYPALVLSSFQPIKVLKGKFQSNKYGTALRNGLVVFQFGISVVLIICTIIVNRQMGYMLGDRLGFRKDHVIEVERTDLVGGKTKAFRAELAGVSGVEQVSGGSTFPGGAGFFGMAMQPFGTKASVTGRGLVVDAQYASTLGLTLSQGRFFSDAFATDTVGVVLNEKAVAALGLSGPVIGARITSPDDFLNQRDGTQVVYNVIGVVKDFHYQTLHQAIAPLYFINAAKFGNATQITALRIRGEDLGTALGRIERIWHAFVPERPFHYTFLDQNLAAQYKAERTVQRIFTVFSVLAIFIACIGLLGLAAYATQQRMREISIRKVLGAGVGVIVSMLAKDFLKLVALAILIAFPIAWLVMHAWLQGFVYRVGLSWWVFALSGLMAFCITILTISFQAIRAAMTNPIRVLRSE